jgi:hypothetical protein
MVLLQELNHATKRAIRHYPDPSTSTFPQGSVGAIGSPNLSHGASKSQQGPNLAFGILRTGRDDYLPQVYRANKAHPWTLYWILTGQRTMVQ